MVLKVHVSKVSKVCFSKVSKVRFSQISKVHVSKILDSKTEELAKNIHTPLKKIFFP